MDAAMNTAINVLRGKWRELSGDEHAFLALTCQGFGHLVSEPAPDEDWSTLSPAALALRWELVWRMRPEFPAEGAYAGELPRYSNPFFNIAVDPLDSILLQRSEGNAEARELLERAAAIERSPMWPSAQPVAERYLADGREYQRLCQTLQSASESSEIEQGLRDLESKLNEEQEYLTRVLLRGSQNDTIAALRAHFTLAEEAAQESADKQTICDVFRDDVAPLMALAYVRVREVPLSPVIAFFAETAARFATLLHERLASPDDHNFPSTPRMKHRERTLEELVSFISSEFPTEQHITGRDFIAARFLEHLRD